MVLCLWMYICIFVAVRFEFELYIYIYIYIYMCVWSDLNLNYFFAGKSTVGAVLDWTALTNTHSRGGWWYSRSYRSPLQGRLILPATPTESTVGAAGVFSCHYRGHCRGSQEHPGKGGWRSRPYRGSRAAPTVKFCSSASGTNSGAKNAFWLLWGLLMNLLKQKGAIMGVQTWWSRSGE